MPAYVENCTLPRVNPCRLSPTPPAPSLHWFHKIVSMGYQPVWATSFTGKISMCKGLGSPGADGVKLIFHH